MNPLFPVIAWLLNWISIVSSSIIRIKGGLVPHCLDCVTDFLWLELKPLEIDMKKKVRKKRLLLWTIHLYLDHTPAWVSKNFVIYLIFLCLSLFTVLFLCAVSFLGCFLARDFCRSGFRQNFMNFYLFTPPPPPAHPPWSFPVPTQNSITVIDRVGLGLVLRVSVSGQG